MQPESSDGFGSVGTILPEERAALLPGGSFRLCRLCGRRTCVCELCRDGIGPLLAALLTFPGIDGIDALKNRIRAPHLGHDGGVKSGTFALRLCDDLRRNGTERRSRAPARADRRRRGRADCGDRIRATVLNPAFDFGLLQGCREFLRLFVCVAVAEDGLPCVFVGAFVVRAVGRIWNKLRHAAKYPA